MYNHTKTATKGYQGKTKNLVVEKKKSAELVITLRSY
jgi:hypothetical protein